MQQSGLDMDIRRWLAETRDPVSSEQAELEWSAVPREPDTVPGARRRRKRSSSDSSLLKAASPHPRRQGVSAKKRDSYAVPDEVDKDHSDTSHSGSSRFTTSSEVSQRYARKPRRKTREDKYTIRSKRPKKHDKGQRPSRKGEPSKMKRMSKRKKNELSHDGVGQNFQARNVSRDRLTLKPSEKVGLLSKGRTSVKGRGLPDLVFSEMKFLRNNHDGNDHTAQAPEPKKKRKKDYTRTREEDISAFFTAVRPVLANTNGNLKAQSGHLIDACAEANADRPKQVQDPSKARASAVPGLESEDKASYLGFGSRWPRSESTSDLSWSESIRAPSITLGQPGNASTDHDKRIDACTRETDELLYSRGTAGHQEVPSSIIRGRIGATSNQVWLPSVAPTQSGLSRSQSLPELLSSPLRPNLIDRAVNRHAKDDIASPSSMPHLLRSRDQACHQEAFETEGSVVTLHVEGMQRRAPTNVVTDHSAHNRPPQLLEMGGTMQHYNGTPEVERQQAPIRRARHSEAHPCARPPDTLQRSRHDLCWRTAGVPAVRFAAPDVYPARLSTLPGSSIYVQQERRQHLSANLGFADHGGYRYPDEFGQGHMSETGALDDESFEELSVVQVPYELLSDIDEGLNDAAEHVPEPEHTSVVAPGFWRPNRLY